MTLTPYRNDLEYRLARLERHTDTVDARLQEVARRHQEIVSTLNGLTEAIERTDAGVTQLCWTLDRSTTAFGIDDDERN